MVVRLHRKGLLAAAGLVAVSVLVALGVAPFVRNRVRAAGALRHLDVHVAGVSLGWLGVRLFDVDARPEGMEGVTAHAAEVRLDLDLHEGRRVAVRGLSVAVMGTTEDLRRRLAKWRDARGEAAASPIAGHHATPVTVESMSFQWRETPTAAPRLAGRDIEVARNDTGSRVKIGELTFRSGLGAISISDASASLDPGDQLVRAHASAILVEVAEGASREPGLPALATEGDRSSDPTPPVRSAAPKAPGTPLVPLPDLRAAWTTVSALSRTLAEHVPEGADLGAGAVTWKVSQAPERVALTIGPGAGSLTRSHSAFEVRFSTDPAAGGTALAVKATVTTGGGDDSLTLEGGPVALSLLGIQEGAAGLAGVAKTTMTGRARLVLGDAGSTLTFDGEAGASDLSLSNPRLASDPIRNLSLAFHARGVATAEGGVRLDDFGASIGAARVVAGGVLEQRPDRVVGTFHFETPSENCQALLDSVPPALLPALQGTEMNGTFGAKGQFSFDSRSLDDLSLDYTVRDLCHVVRVPSSLARDRFVQPFIHQAYLPDGTIADVTTGPGSADWTPLDQISPYMQVAVLTTEDGGFPRHHGFNRSSIRSSIIANLKARRFVRGASTITMQLAKNLFLAREKTLSRKLEEVVLTDYLEQTFSKDELMELYLNVIEFGPAVYGITDAAEYYFGRTPGELNLGECLFLSSLLPAPLRYGAMRDSGEVSDRWMHMLRSLMEVAHRNGRISDSELAEGRNETIVFWRGGDRPAPRPPVRPRTEFGGEADDVTTAPTPDPPPTP